MADLDPLDVRTALAALHMYRSVHEKSHLPVPPAVDRVTANLQTLLTVNGQSDSTSAQDWLTTEQIAERLQCSERTARRIARRVGHRVGRQWLTPADAIED